MVGFILACPGHRYRAVAGSNPALPTILASFACVLLLDGGFDRQFSGKKPELSWTSRFDVLQ